MLNNMFLFNNILKKILNNKENNIPNKNVKAIVFICSDKII